MSFPGGSEGKESACSAGDVGSIPELGRFTQRRKWQPTPVLLPGKSHGQRDLAGYSPWGLKRAGHDLVTNTTDTLIFTAPGPSTRQAVMGHWKSVQVASSFILPLLISNVLIWVRVCHVKGVLRQDFRGQSISGAQTKKCAPGADLVF